MVFSRMVSLISLLNMWSLELEKCLYIGRVVLILHAALCPAILCDRFF